MAKDIFGEAVFRLEADNNALVRGMKTSEAVVTKSVNKMTTELARIPVAMQSVGTSATDTAGALNLVAASAGVAGGRIGSVISPVASLATVVNSLTASNIALGGSFKALGVFLLPFAPIFAAVTAAAGGLFLVYRKIAGASRILRESEEKLAAEEKELTARFDARRVASQKAEQVLIKGLEKRVALAKGAQESDFLTGRPQQLQLELERLARVAKGEVDRATRKKQFQEEEKRRLERLVQIEKLRTMEAERLAKARRDEQHARQLARETGGASVTNRGEALKTVTFLAKSMEALALSARLIKQAVLQALQLRQITGAQALAITGLSLSPAASSSKSGGSVSGSLFRGRAGGTGVIAEPQEVKANNLRKDLLAEAIKTNVKLGILAMKPQGIGP